MSSMNILPVPHQQRLENHTPKEWKKRQDTLSSHVRRKSANHPWIADCLDGKISTFPYRVFSSGKATISPKTFCSIAQNDVMPSPPRTPCPVFVINIPQGVSPKNKHEDTHFQSMISRIQSEAFSTNTYWSKTMGKQRLAVVVGTNQIESIDPAKNRALRNLIGATQQFNDFCVRRIGFFWRPEWSRTSYKEALYPVKKAFLLLKALSKKTAKKVQETFEQPKGRLHPNILAQIPYGAIRQRILKSNKTREIIQHFSNAFDACPCYLTIMDADFEALRLTGERLGVFSQVSASIDIHNPFTVIGTSYQVGANEPPLIRLAVRIDMAVREAMSSVIPYSAYLPEPLLFTLVKRSNQNNNLKHLSFLGKGNALESRRLVENAKPKGAVSNHMKFLKAGLQTASPERWKTKSMLRFPTLSARQIKQMQALKALRGLAQTHAFPRQWAGNVYAALNFSCHPVTDATTAMMRIFAVFDPISRMQAHIGKYSTRVFDAVMNNYDRAPTEVEQSIITTQKAKLSSKGMDDAMIAKVIQAAKVSGAAIHRVLQQHL